MAPRAGRSRSPTGQGGYKEPVQGDINRHTGTPYSKKFFQILGCRRKLPCWDMRSKVVEMVSANLSSVLIGETGSGKTTQVPQFLLDGGFAKKGAIAITQPRRVAAMSVAARVAQEMDVELGQEVGYLIRFEDVTSENTVLKYMTDGMLLRECMTDPLMSKYSAIVLDEAHERTLATDILFGLLKEVLQKRPDLRCLVMSATLEAEKFQEYWSGAPLLRVPGRMYPVETFFSLAPEKDYVQAAVSVCGLIHAREPPGDILLFLTGEEEIERACAEIADQASDDSLLVLPLYSSLPMAQQRKVFPPAPEGTRKVIIATNIAETSLTIDGVVYVVDPGLFKQMLYNPRTHVESLLVSPISKASAMQRAGRAGRTRPGKCFRLYTLETFDKELPESTYPEIIRSNLSSVVLQLKKLGVEDIVHFDFMEPPSPESMMRALEMLHFLGAIDDESDLTEIGAHMADFPVDPHLSRTIVAAAHRGCIEEVLTIVAMLSVPPPFFRPRWGPKKADRAHKAFAMGPGDHLSLLSVYSQFSQAENKAQFCQDNFFHERSLKQAESISRQLRGIVRNRGLAKTKNAPEENLIAAVRKSFIEGFFMQTAHIDSSGKNYITVRDLQMVSVHPASFLQHKPEWVLYHETVVTDRCYMRNVTAIPPEMLIEVAPQFYHPKTCKLSEQAKKSLERALPRSKRKASG
uniref:RNA helicase n=1 Tax=Zooxanthella nutricula TaxID=1333877 RepID=A0A6U6GGX8_9DINO